MSSIGVDEFAFYDGEPVNEYLNKSVIDYSVVDEVLNDRIEESINYLRHSLANISKEKKNNGYN